MGFVQDIAHFDSWTDEKQKRILADVQALLDKNDKLRAELDKHRWISVGERLPEDEVEVLALVVRDGEPTIYQVDYQDAQHKWRNENGDTIAVGATHWKPIILPEGE